MPHVIELIDGELLVPFELKDVLDVVEQYAGTELRAYLEEYIDDYFYEQEDYKSEAEDREKELDRSADHQKMVLDGIALEIDSMEKVLDAPRMDRKKICRSVRCIRALLDAER